MRRIPFPTESYQHPSLPLSAKRLLNCYAEDAPNDARAPFVLRTVPGLVYRETLGTGPVYAINTENVDGYYAVSGAEAFRHLHGVTTNIGNVGLASDPAIPPQHAMVTIAVSTQHVVICSPPRLYAATHSAPALTQIDTTDFPGGGCNSITYFDGYWVGTQHGGGNEFFVSALQDPFTWEALDFASADAMVTNSVRAITHRGELWLLGISHGEVWYDAGAADFPFRRQNGGVLDIGFVPRSVGRIDNSIWWVSRDGSVYRSNGYKAERVSTHAVEAIIEQGNPDYAVGISYMQEGHAFYVITLSDMGRTLCYDIATKQWHDRSSDPSGAGAWRPLAGGRMGEVVLMGDATGRLYHLDADGTTDNGVLIQQQVTMPPLYAATRRAFCARAELEMEAPPATDVLLSWSDDGGHTFNAPRVMSGADVQAMRRRLVATRLGSFRERVFRVQTQGRVSLYGMDADISTGAH
jgi:hypothetical protein